MSRRQLASSADIDAERSVLGAIMLQPDAIERLSGLSPESFFDFRHGAIFEAMRALDAQRKPIDEITLEAQLEQAGKLDAIGGLSYLAELALRVPTADNIEHYAAIVREGRVTRDVVLALGRAQQAFHDGLGGRELLSEALRLVTRIDAGDEAEAVPVSQIARERWFELQRLAEQAKDDDEVVITGLPTGMAKLDGLLGGLQPGIVTVLAARPGMGKSATALCIVDAATAAGHGAHVFSLEDTRSAYADRVLARHSGISSEDIRRARFHGHDIAKMNAAATRMQTRKNWIVDDAGGVTADELIRRARRRRRDTETRLVVVDYLTLLRGRPGVWDRGQVIDESMTAFSDAAKADNMAYLVLAQLNRDCEKRDDKRPQMSDLRQAGEIEERAKCVLMLYRDGAYYDDAPQDEMEILVRKNNHGRVGMVKVRWDGATARLS